jgi:hypothetical protein
MLLRFLSVIKLRFANNLCNSVYHKDHAPKSGLQPAWDEYLIFYLSLEGNRFPFANVTIAKAAQMQFACHNAGGEPRSNQALDGVGDK